MRDLIERLEEAGASRSSLVCGDCYRWAFNSVTESGGTLVHGMVSEPFSSPVKKYLHAWVERGGKVYDWQTMEAGHGGKWSGKGYPIRTFYELFSPSRMTRYTSREATRKAMSSSGGRVRGGLHFGPWE